MFAKAWCDVFASLPTLADKLALRSVSKEFYAKYSIIEDLVTRQELAASNFLFEQRGNVVAEITYETQRSLLCLLHLKQCIDKGISASLYTTQTTKYWWLISSLSLHKYSPHIGRGRELFLADRIIYDAPSNINDQLVERLFMKLDPGITKSIFEDKTKELIVVKYCGLTELYRFTVAKFNPVYTIPSRHVSVMLDVVFGGISEVITKLKVDRIYTLGIEWEPEGVTVPILAVDYLKRRDYDYKQDDCVMFYFSTTKQRGKKLEIYKFLSDLNSQLRVLGKRLVFVVDGNHKSSDTHFAMNMLLPEHKRSITQTTKYEGVIDGYNYATIPLVPPTRKRKSRSWEEPFDSRELEECLSMNTSWERENFDWDSCWDPYEDAYI